MMKTADTGVLLTGVVQVNTTNNRGLNAEEIAVRAADRIISVGANSHPVIRDQAQAFKEHIKKVVEFYVKEAIQNDRATLAVRLRDAGYPDLVTLLER